MASQWKFSLYIYILKKIQSCIYCHYVLIFEECELCSSSHPEHSQLFDCASQ